MATQCPWKVILFRIGIFLIIAIIENNKAQALLSDDQTVFENTLTRPLPNFPAIVSGPPPFIGNRFFLEPSAPSLGSDFTDEDKTALSRSRLDTQIESVDPDTDWVMVPRADTPSIITTNVEPIYQFSFRKIGEFLWNLLPDLVRKTPISDNSVSVKGVLTNVVSVNLRVPIHINPYPAKKALLYKGKNEPRGWWPDRHSLSGVTCYLIPKRLINDFLSYLDYKKCLVTYLSNKTGASILASFSVIKMGVMLSGIGAPVFGNIALYAVASYNLGVPFYTDVSQIVTWGKNIYWFLTN
jgi:hypothetical protein